MRLCAEAMAGAVEPQVKALGCAPSLNETWGSTVPPVECPEGLSPLVRVAHQRASVRPKGGGRARGNDLLSVFPTGDTGTERGADHGL